MMTKQKLLICMVGLVVLASVSSCSPVGGQAAAPTLAVLPSSPTAVPTLVSSPAMTATLPQPSRIGQIVFASQRGGNLEIYLTNLTKLPQGIGGTKPVRLTETQTRNGPPVPAPDGKRIAFVAEKDTNGAIQDREIYTVNIDGSGLTNLTSNPAIDQEPAWSPDGMRIAFASNRAGDHYSNSIYTMQADGNGVKRLAQNGDSPAWSPDSKRIAFLSSRDQQIYIVNADGSNLQRLTNSPAPGNGTAQGAPVWSPDGKRIVFRSNRDGNSEIYVMNSDGSGQTNLTKNKAYDDFPVWSPDGEWIAFISNRDGQAGLYVTLAPHAVAGTNTGGNDVIRLMKGSASMPRWSPDSRWIVCVGGSGDGNQDIYLVSADGGESVNLTNHPAQDTFPAWLP
jgi:Tol biopolymer transport system component